jgi:hypothetical protein
LIITKELDLEELVLLQHRSMVLINSLGILSTRLIWLQISEVPLETLPLLALRCGLLVNGPFNACSIREEPRDG